MTTYAQNLKNLKNKKEIKTTKVFNLNNNEIIEVKNEILFALLNFNKNLEIYDEKKHKIEEKEIIINNIEEKQINEEVKEILEQKSEEQLEQTINEVEEIIKVKKTRKTNKNK